MHCKSWKPSVKRKSAHLVPGLISSHMRRPDTTMRVMRIIDEDRANLSPSHNMQISRDLEQWQPHSSYIFSLVSRTCILNTLIFKTPVDRYCKTGVAENCSTIHPLHIQYLKAPCPHFSLPPGRVISSCLCINAVL